MPNPPAAPKPKSEAEILTEQIKSPDPAIARQAIETVERRIAENPAAGYGELRWRWAEAMVKGRRCQKLPELALAGVLEKPEALLNRLSLQTCRVQALLQLGRPQEALSEARALYNLAPMAGVAEAIELVSQCLAAAYPQDLEIAQRFRVEQLAGARIAIGPAVEGAAPSTQPSISPPTGLTFAPAEILRGSAPAKQTILDAIVVDPKPYEAAIAAAAGDDWNSLRRQAVLLLLSNRPAEAQEAAEKAYAIAPQAALVPASELIAISLKARDGCVGRANAWVLAIRPGDAK